jgi:hypothetical protein
MAFTSCVVQRAFLLTIASPSASTQPASPASTGPSINEVDGALDIDITSKRLDEARQQIHKSRRDEVSI